MRSDRTGNTQRWKDANLHNLMAGDTSQYTQIDQRRDFYMWFYNHTAALGYATRWALAASVVANGAYELANMPFEPDAITFGAVTNELQGVMRQGNQVIFDNVFPKLRQLLIGGPLTGRAALQWDMQVLSEEQQLIQPLYASMGAPAFAALENAARQRGFLVNAGSYISSADNVDAGPHNRGGNVPAFSGGDLRNSTHRWEYGMQLGNTFAPSPTGYTAGTPRPIPGAGYSDGTELARVNTRPNLHQLDGQLNNYNTAVGSEVRAILGRLTPQEQAELMRDQSPDGGAYHAKIRNVITWSQMFPIIATYRVGLVTQMNFMDRFLSGTWDSVHYPTYVSPMVTAFPGQGMGLATAAWRGKFIDMCDDTTMRQAVRELGLDPATARTWIETEESLNPFVR